MFIGMVIYFFVGMFAGTVVGLLGIGSGVLIVPALVYVFSLQGVIPADITMQVAAGTSLASIFLSTSRALLVHLKHKIEIWTIYRRLFIGVVIGTLAGAVLSHHLSSRVLSIIFGIVIFILGVKMFLPPGKEAHRRLPSDFWCHLVGLLIGTKSGLLGLGGGSVSTPFLTHYGVSMRRSVVTSTAISATISAIGTVTFIVMGHFTPGLPEWTIGYVYLPAWLSISVGSLLFVPFGVWLSHRTPVLVLRRIFATTLLLIGLHMLYITWR